MASRVSGWAGLLSAGHPTTTSDAIPLPRVFGIGDRLREFEGLSSIVAHRKASVRAKHKEVQRELLQLLRMTSKLLGAYESMNKDILTFADQEVVNHQAKLDQVWKVWMCQTSSLKPIIMLRMPCTMHGVDD